MKLANITRIVFILGFIASVFFGFSYWNSYEYTLNMAANPDKGAALFLLIFVLILLGIALYIVQYLITSKTSSKDKAIVKTA